MPCSQGCSIRQQTRPVDTLYMRTIIPGWLDSWSHDTNMQKYHSVKAGLIIIARNAPHLVSRRVLGLTGQYLTSVIAKLMQSLITDITVQHIMFNNLFADKQHGVVPRHSEMTQRFVVVEAWTERGIPVYAIYLEFSIWHLNPSPIKQLIKLEAYGIQEKLLTWIGSSLTGRHLCWREIWVKHDRVVSPKDLC